MNDTAMNQLTIRLENLERQNRNLNRTLSGLVFGVVALMMVGAAFSGPNEDPKDGTFGTIHAARIVVNDYDGRDRMILELNSGEPALRMFDHDGRQQVFLGIDELWQDTAYLSVSARLPNGDIDKQAVLAAATSAVNSPGNCQLVLFDATPEAKDPAGRRYVRLSSGVSDRKAFMEIAETSDKAQREVNLGLLKSKPATNGRRVLLDTNSDPATLSGLTITP